MKTFLVLALTSALFATARAGEKADAISQIMVTQYTGGDAAHPRGEPIYRVWLQADGTVTYVGGKTYMKRTGRWRGTVAHKDFRKLARLFDGKFKKSYNVYDNRDVARQEFGVVRAGQKTVIDDYESSGPLPLKRASQIFYGLLWKIDWQKVSPSDTIDF